MGINVNRVNLLAFGIGVGCLGIAGPVMMPVFYVVPNIGTFFILIAFVVVVLGGIGNFMGALVASFVVAIAESLGALFMPGSTAPVLPFLLFILVLLFKPEGLFGAQRQMSGARTIACRRSPALVLLLVAAAPALGDISVHVADPDPAVRVSEPIAGTSSAASPASFRSATRCSWRSAPTRRRCCCCSFGISPWIGMIAGGVLSAAARPVHRLPELPLSASRAHILRW